MGRLTQDTVRTTCRRGRKGRKEERERDGWKEDKRRKEKMRSRNEEANHGITG
jgi:hypothetical protein